MTNAKTITLDSSKSNLVRWDLSESDNNSNEQARELLKLFTGVDCTPCEGGSGFLRGSLDFYEDYSGKGRTVVYEWMKMEDGSVTVDYTIDDNEVWNMPSPSERLSTWFNNAPEDYNANKILEMAAKEAANSGSNINLWGQAHAIACMSDIHVTDVMTYIAYYASTFYGKTVRNVAA